jgi:rhodanese-related sulfurtransferase
MDAPFYKFGMFGENASLVVAFVIGIGFGFFLERAGFGSGNKLARQFYFRDMAVLKVMFSAIVTAMLGVFFLSRLGLMDLSLIYLTPTNVWAQVVGGLVLGVGFVIGGYCPGTSIVAAATGRVDAMVYMGGMFAGMVMVGFAMPALEGLMNAGAMGQLTLATAWNIPYGVLVAAVGFIAAGAFLASEWAEVRSGGKQRAEQKLLYVAGLSSSRRFVGAVVVLGVVAAFAGNPFRGSSVRVSTNELAALVASEADHLTVDELASRLIAGSNTLRIIDLRPADAYAKYHLPGAESVPVAALAQLEVLPGEPLLLYSGADEHAAQAWVLLKARGLKAYALRGGLVEWQERVLYPRLSENPAERLDNDRRVAVARHFGGSPRGTVAEGAPMPELKLPTPPLADVPSEQGAPVKKKKKEGC